MQCTKHDTSNGSDKAEKYYKKIRAKDKETVNISSANAVTTFVARKFKETSLYVHQKSVHLLAAINKEYGRDIMKFVQSLLSSLVYCRGQRKLNLLANCQHMLYLRPYVQILIDSKFDGRPILSDAAEKLIKAISSNTYLFIELMGFSFIFDNFMMPIIEEAKGSAVDIDADHLPKILSEIRSNLKDKPFIIIDAIFGFEKLSKYFISGTRLNLKYKVPAQFARDDDIVYNSQKNIHFLAENITKFHIYPTENQQHQVIAAVIVSFVKLLESDDAEIVDVEPLYTLKETHEIIASLTISYALRTYLNCEDGIKYEIEANDAWQPTDDYQFQSILFAKIKKSYHKYHSRHFIAKDHAKFEDESKEIEDGECRCNPHETYKDLYYFHEHSLIHHFLYEFTNYKQIYHFNSITKGAVTVNLDYLIHFANWNEFKEKGGFAGLYHNDFIEGNHGLSSYLIKFASLLSDEHIENKNIGTRSKLYIFWQYLQKQYPKTAKLIKDISWNVNVSQKHQSSKQQKQKIKQNKIAYIQKKINTKKSKTQKPTKQKEPAPPKPKLTKFAKHVQSEYNKKNKKKKAELKKVKFAVKRQKQKQQQLKKKKKKKVDIFKDYDFDEFQADLISAFNISTNDNDTNNNIKDNHHKSNKNNDTSILLNFDESDDDDLLDGICNDKESDDDVLEGITFMNGDGITKGIGGDVILNEKSDSDEILDLSMYDDNHNNNKSKGRKRKQSKAKGGGKSKARRKRKVAKQRKSHGEVGGANDDEEIVILRRSSRLKNK